MHKSNTLFNNFLLFISSIIFFFTAAELGKRTYDKIYHNRNFFNYVYDVFEIKKAIYIWTEKGKRYRPNISFTSQHKWRPRKKVDMKINSLGFRDDELHTKERNEFRILMLGDSITVGSYLEKKNVYPEQLERQLNNIKGKTRFQVINGGITDIGLAEEVDILHDSGIKVQPDLVGIGFYLNDSRAPWAFHVETDFLYNISIRSRFLNWLWRQIYFEYYIRDLGLEGFAWVKIFNERKWINNREIFYKLIDEAKLDWGASWQDASWKIIKRKLDEVLNLEKKHNFKTFLFCFPASVQVESEIFDNKPQRFIKKICHDKNIPFLDLLPILRDNKSKNLFYDQCHLKPVGNKIVADVLYKFLNETNLIPNLGKPELNSPLNSFIPAIR